MKLITALRIIEEREKRARKAKREMQENGILSKSFDNSGGLDDTKKEETGKQKNLIHVQSIFPQDDILALKMKTGEPHVREAINKAVYFFLQQGKTGEISGLGVPFEFRWY